METIQIIITKTRSKSIELQILKISHSAHYMYNVSFSSPLYSKKHNKSNVLSYNNLNLLNHIIVVCTDVEGVRGGSSWKTSRRISKKQLRNTSLRDVSHSCRNL